MEFSLVSKPFLQEVWVQVVEAGKGIRSVLGNLKSLTTGHKCYWQAGLNFPT